MHDAARLGVAAQELRVKGGVDVIGVIDPRRDRIGLVRNREAAKPGRHARHRPVIERRGVPLGAGAQPMRLEERMLSADTEGAERMEVALAGRAPVAEVDTQLVGALGRRNKLGLVNAEKLVKRDQAGNRGLANPDRTDEGRLDQGDFARRSQDLGHGRGGHPAGRAATDDDDAAQGRNFGTVVGHGVGPCLGCVLYDFS